MASDKQTPQVYRKFDKSIEDSQSLVEYYTEGLEQFLDNGGEFDHNQLNATFQAILREQMSEMYITVHFVFAEVEAILAEKVNTLPEQGWPQDQVEKLRQSMEMYIETIQGIRENLEEEQAVWENNKPLQEGSERVFSMLAHLRQIMENKEVVRSATQLLKEDQ